MKTRAYKKRKHATAFDKTFVYTVCKNFIKYMSQHKPCKISTVYKAGLHSMFNRISSKRKRKLERGPLLKY